jgi:cold shock CspA family protein
MRGTIKFVDPKTRLWGFIIPEDNGMDVYFQTSNFVGARPTTQDAGTEVEFELEEDAQGRHAKNARFLAPPAGLMQTQAGARTSDKLKEWAYIPFFSFRGRDGKDYSSVLELLASKALPERWYYGEIPSPHNPFPVLDNYLKYTFLKLKR